MKRRVKTAFTVSIISLLLISFAFGEVWPLGFPTAVEDGVSAIPLTTLTAIAEKEASLTWGNTFLGTIIPCSGADGKLSHYYFVFRINTPVFGDYADIQGSLIKARADFVSCALNTPEAVKAGKKFRGKYREAYETYIRARDKKWGAGEYGTIVVSATKEFFPIPEKIYGLPPFYTVLDLMLEKLRHAGRGAKLTKIYYISPMDQYYEFKTGSDTFLINGLSLLEVKTKDVLSLAAASRDTELKKAITQEWKKHGL